MLLAKRAARAGKGTQAVKNLPRKSKMQSFRLTPRGAQYDVVSRLTGAGGSTAGQVGLVCQFVVICRQAVSQLSAARQLCTFFFLRRYPFLSFLSCFQGGIPCGMGMHLVGHAAAALYLCHHTIHTPRTRVNVLLSVVQTRDWLGNHQMGFVDGGQSSCHIPNLKYQARFLIRGFLCPQGWVASSSSSRISPSIGIDLLTPPPPPPPREGCLP